MALPLFGILARNMAFNKVVIKIKIYTHVLLRGHVQTIFGKINVIMTLRGVACDANFFVCVLLSFC